MDDIERAFAHTPRKEFLPEDAQSHASEDRPLSIGYGQTNSQPSTVRAMLKWLKVQKGDTILDVGSGSGWTTALLAYLTGSEGTVEATERIPQLVAFGKENCKRLNIHNASFHQAGKGIGWPNGAPYDRILVSASAERIPQELLSQLKPYGKMVIPVGDTILEITIDDTGEVLTTRHPGFVFVPLL